MSERQDQIRSVALAPTGSLVSEAPAEGGDVLGIAPSAASTCSADTQHACEAGAALSISRRRKLRPRTVEGLLSQEREAGRPDLKLGVPSSQNHLTLK